MDTPADITKAAASHIEMTQAGDDRKAIDADAGDLMAATIKVTKLSHFSCASLQFYGFLAVVYCSMCLSPATRDNNADSMQIHGAMVSIALYLEL